MINSLEHTKMFLRLTLLQEELHHEQFARDCLIKTNDTKNLQEVDERIVEIKEEIDRILEDMENSHWF